MTGCHNIYNEIQCDPARLRCRPSIARGRTDPETRDELEMTAVEHAVREGDVELVDLLVNFGAKLPYQVLLVLGARK